MDKVPTTMFGFELKIQNRKAIESQQISTAFQTNNCSISSKTKNGDKNLFNRV